MFNNRNSGRLFFVIGSFLLICLSQNAFAQKQTMGLIEKAKIYPKGLILDAKLDTGADSCSLHASNIKEFEKDGREFVKFTIIDRYGKKQEVEKEVMRHVRIKRLDGKSQVRKMIHIGLCLGGVYKIAEVSLVNRGKFNYEMLIGRRFLAGDFIVDPSITYTVDPTCEVNDDSGVKKESKTHSQSNND